MDAGIVLNIPTPAAPAADAAPDRPDDDATSFAAHLEPDDGAARPAQRRAPRTTPDDDAASEAPTPDPQTGNPPTFALSVPTAPVIVRIDAAPGVLDVAATPAATAVSPTAQTQTTPLPPAPAPATPAPQQQAAAPSQDPAPTFEAALAAAGLEPPPSAPPPTASADAPSQKPAAAEPQRNGARDRLARTESADTNAPKAAAQAQDIVPAVQAAERNGAGNDSPGGQGNTAQQQHAATKIEVTAAATPVEAAPAAEARRIAEASPPVHRPPTVAATVAQHVIRRFDGNATTIDVRLDPAELGRVHVKLDVGADSRVTAVVSADNPATLSDLMRSSRDLERALESAGLELASGGLSFDLSDRRGAFGAGEENSADASALRGGAEEDASVAATPAPASRPFGLETWRGVRVDMTV